MSFFFFKNTIFIPKQFKENYGWESTTRYLHIHIYQWALQDLERESLNYDATADLAQLFEWARGNVWFFFQRTINTTKLYKNHINEQLVRFEGSLLKTGENKNTDDMMIWEKNLYYFLLR